MNIVHVDRKGKKDCVCIHSNVRKERQGFVGEG